MNPHSPEQLREVNYTSLHKRVYRKRGKPNFCEHCKTTKAKKFEWANVSGNYEDVGDYIRLCTKCHCKFDNRIHNLNLSKMNQKICGMCKKLFKPVNSNHHFCGNASEKIGCSYERHLEFKRIQYFRLKKKKLSETSLHIN